jgi:hypothetical protein
MFSLEPTSTPHFCSWGRTVDEPGRKDILELTERIQLERHQLVRWGMRASG